MVYNGIAEYLNKLWGITEFWISDLRVMKTTEGTWVSIKDGGKAI